MTSYSYPYTKEKFDDTDVYRPKIPIRLSYNGKFVNVIALVDSGSDISLIPKGLAEILELNLNVKKREVVGIGGELPVKRTGVNLSLITKDDKIIHLGKMPVDVPLDENFGYVILGRIPFFEGFEVTFKENKKRTVLTLVKRR